MALAAHCARYDEMIKAHNTRAVSYLPAATRREAINLAALEGILPRKENLARLMGNRELTNIDKASRIALDMADALSLIENSREAFPSTKAIVDIFMISDASFGRLKRADFEWSIEEDAFWLQSIISEMPETATVLDWIELLRVIWSSGRFSSCSRRISMLLTPWCMQKAFSCSFPVYGIAEELRGNVDEFRTATSSSFAWRSAFAHHAQIGIRKEIERLKDIPATITSLRALCPSERASSSLDAAFLFMLGTPVFNIKAFAKAMSLTERGAKVVIDKLLDANILEIEGGLRNRLFICKRTI